MKSTDTAVDDRIVRTQDVTVGQDSRGNSLSHYCLAERVMQVEYHRIADEIRTGTTPFSTPSSETLVYMLEGGFRGFHNMSPGELWSEWNEVEDKFWELYDSNSLPWEVNDEDPLAKQPRSGPAVSTEVTL